MGFKNNNNFKKSELYRNHSTSNPPSECCEQPNQVHSALKHHSLGGKHPSFLIGSMFMGRVPLTVLPTMYLVPRAAVEPAQSLSQHSLAVALGTLNDKPCFTLRAAPKVSQGRLKLIIQHKPGKQLWGSESNQICCLEIHGELLSLPPFPREGQIQPHPEHQARD